MKTPYYSLALYKNSLFCKLNMQDNWLPCITMRFDVRVAPPLWAAYQRDKSTCFLFHWKEIRGFAQKQPNLEISNKARLLPPAPLCLAVSVPHAFACSLRKQWFSCKSPSCEKRGLWRIVTEGTKLVANRERERGVCVCVDEKGPLKQLKFALF